MDEPDFRAALQQLADAVDGWEAEPAADDPLAIAMDHARKVLFPRLARLMQEPTVGDSIRSTTTSAGLPEPDVDHILRLAAIIRKVDGGNRLGAAALAEAILAHPGFSSCHVGPVASPAQGEVAELVAALEADAECVAAEQPDLMQLTDKQLTRIAHLLKAGTQPVDADRGQA